MRLRLSELDGRVTALAEAAALAGGELRQVQTHGHSQRQSVAVLEEEAQTSQRRLSELQTQVQADKASHLEQMRQAAHLQNDAVSFKAHLDNLTRERERLRLRNEQASENLASLDIELEELTEADESLQAKLIAVRQ